MRSPRAQLSVGLVCLLLGLALVTQFRTYHVVAKTGLSPADQAVVINRLVDGNGALRREVEDLEQKIDAIRGPDSASVIGAMERELVQLKVATGVAPVSGPGVEVLVSGDVKPEELGDLLNELRNAGAEASAVNGRRLGTRSVFTSGSHGFQVDGREITPPFRFAAIADSTTLETALSRKGGVVSLLKASYPGHSIQVTQRDRIDLPANEEWLAGSDSARPAP